MHALLDECDILLLSTTHVASVDSLTATGHILTVVCKPFFLEKYFVSCD